MQYSSALDMSNWPVAFLGSGGATEPLCGISLILGWFIHGGPLPSLSLLAEVGPWSFLFVLPFLTLFPYILCTDIVFLGIFEYLACLCLLSYCIFSE